MAQDGFNVHGGDHRATQLYDRSPDEPITTAVTMAVTDVLDRDIESLRPLGEVLDADALESLSESSDESVEIEFEYENCLVTIRRGTEIFVTPKT